LRDRAASGFARSMLIASRDREGEKNKASKLERHVVQLTTKSPSKGNLKRHKLTVVYGVIKQRGESERRTLCIHGRSSTPRAISGTNQKMTKNRRGTGRAT